MTPVMLITGGSRGIGAATARLAARKGYDIAITYAQDEEAANGVVADAEACGRRALALRCRVENESDVVGAFKATIAQMGSLSALVNNAGVLDRAMRLDKMTAERMRRIFDVNILGSFLCAREAVRHMSTRHGGRGGGIVNVSSVGSRLGSPNEYLDYAASKGALDTFTVGLAKEVAAEGIRVNAVRPGLIDTEIHGTGGDPDRAFRLADQVPMERVGTPAEVAELILWLLSDAASYVTGALIDVAGGR